MAEGEVRLRAGGTYLSKKVASSLRSSTLCFTPAHRWQFMSWPRVMQTPEPAPDTQ